MIAELWWRLVRFGFRLLYYEMAFTYDWVSKIVSLGAWRSWQRAALQHLPPPETGQILELAHGTGDLQIDLQNAGYAPLGADLSPYMGGIARRKLQRSGYAARLTRADATQLPFASASFCAVVCTFPTPFILQPSTLTELQRVLIRGGRLVIVPSGVLTGSGVWVRLLEWLYHITGQREGEMSAFVGALQAAGFAHVESHQVPCTHSVAWVVVAETEKKG